MNRLSSALTALVLLLTSFAGLPTSIRPAWQQSRIHKIWKGWRVSKFITPQLKASDSEAFFIANQCQQLHNTYHKET